MTRSPSFSKQMEHRHLGATRALGYVLTLGTIDAWSDFAALIASRLDVPERAALAFWALRSLSDDNAALVMREASALIDVPAPAGPPLAPLCELMDEATFWADMADPAECEAYCLAAFNRMAPGRQAAFLDHVQGRAAA